jgi:hypothetical protein
MKGLKINNSYYGAFCYDVAVVFGGKRTTVEVWANSMTEAGKLVASRGYELAPLTP